MQVKQFEIGMLMNNTYVVWCERTRQGLVVDPVGAGPAVARFIQDHDLKIGILVYTHAHPDHVSGAAALRRATGARVAAHPLARKIMRGPMILICSGLGLIFRPVIPDQALDHGQVLQIGNDSLTVLHTPGHTPDGICLAGPGLVFTGDTLINEAVGRTDLPGGSAQQLARSIREILLPLGDATTVYPGHGPATTLGHERQFNPFLH